MSTKKAQSIANDIQDKIGLSIVSFQNNELEWLKAQLEDFLDLEIETDELSDPEDLAYEGGDEEEWRAAEVDSD